MFVSDAELAPCMLCCPVHVSKRKPRVQGLNWWKRKNSVFNFQIQFFLLFHFYPCFILTFPPSDFSHTHQNSPWPFSFLLKPSSPSPLQNQHHRRRSTMDFWRTKQFLVKVSLTFISPSPPIRFHHFFGRFFIFVFSFQRSSCVFYVLYFVSQSQIMTSKWKPTLSNTLYRSVNKHVLTRSTTHSLLVP